MNNTHDCCIATVKSMFRVLPENSESCPSCNQKSKVVPTSAIILSLEGFSFCSTSSCELVYFKNTFVIHISDLKYSIGFKNNSHPSTVCYCFNWTKEKIQKQLEEKGTTTALEEIKEKIKNKKCLCEIKNPKGKCCMSDMKKTINEIKSKLFKESI